jgi:hypothetical protein
MQNIVADAYRAPLNYAGPLSGVIEDIDSGQEASFHNLNALKSLPGGAIPKSTPGLQHRHFILFSRANIGREMMP